MNTSTGAATQRAKMPVPEVEPDSTTAQELHDRVELRAYRLYEERGYEPGHDMEHWLQAEQEVLAERMGADLG